MVARSICFSTVLFIFGTATTTPASTADPPDKTVRVFYVLPSDVALDSAYPKGIAGVMKSSQKYFLAQCKYTFRLNNPVCEVVKSDKPRSWFASVDDYWNIVFRGTDEVYRILPAVNADSRRARWKIVIYVDAESPKDGGGGGNGWVGLPKHDADGAKIYPRDSARWCGGMCHELGHCFGLPDASSTDGTVMSASFYGWPNCIFTANHISTMKNLPANAGFWYDNIVGTLEDRFRDMTPGEWAPLVQGNHLIAAYSIITGPTPASIGLYDMTGKRTARFDAATTISGITRFSFDISRVAPGTYVCTIEKNGVIMQKASVRKTY